MALTYEIIKDHLSVTPFEPTSLAVELQFTETPFDNLMPAAYLYLKYDWDNDSDNDEDPDGEATFGLYEGRKSIIFQREVIG